MSKQTSNNILQVPGEKKLSQREFLKLQKEWYSKLAKTGFTDIETVLPDGSSSHLTKSAPGVQGRKHTEAYMENNSTYYTNASRFFWAKQWNDEVEKRIWELHAEGISYRKIIQDLAPTKKLGLEQMNKIIGRLKTEMNIWVDQEFLEASEEEDQMYAALVTSSPTPADPR